MESARQILSGFLNYGQRTIGSFALSLGKPFNRQPFGIVLRKLVVQNNIRQRLMNSDAAVVFDKTELAKSIHEEAHA